MSYGGFISTVFLVVVFALVGQCCAQEESEADAEERVRNEFMAAVWFDPLAREGTLFLEMLFDTVDRPGEKELFYGLSRIKQLSKTCGVDCSNSAFKPMCDKLMPIHDAVQKLLLAMTARFNKPQDAAAKRAMTEAVEPFGELMLDIGATVPASWRSRMQQLK